MTPRHQVQHSRTLPGLYHWKANPLLHRVCTGQRNFKKCVCCFPGLFVCLQTLLPAHTLCKTRTHTQGSQGGLRLSCSTRRLISSRLLCRWKTLFPWMHVQEHTSECFKTCRQMKDFVCASMMCLCTLWQQGMFACACCLLHLCLHLCCLCERLCV